MTSSKSRKAERRRRRRRKRRQKPLESLKRKLEQGLLQGQEFVIEPSGEVKMSEVLTAFVEPYLESTNAASLTEEDYRKLLMLAIVAWNAALLPEEDQQDTIDKAVKAIPATSWAMRAFMRAFMSELIERKKTYFSEYTRMIIDFELTDLGEEYHLSVASTLEKPPSP